MSVLMLNWLSLTHIRNGSREFVSDKESVPLVEATGESVSQFAAWSSHRIGPPRPRLFPAQQGHERRLGVNYKIPCRKFLIIRCYNGHRNVALRHLLCKKLISGMLKNVDRFGKRAAKEKKELINSSRTGDDAEPHFYGHYT